MNFGFCWNVVRSIFLAQHISDYFLMRHISKSFHFWKIGLILLKSNRRDRSFRLLKSIIRQFWYKIDSFIEKAFRKISPPLCVNANMCQCKYVSIQICVGFTTKQKNWTSDNLTNLERHELRFLLECRERTMQICVNSNMCQCKYVLALRLNKK